MDIRPFRDAYGVGLTWDSGGHTIDVDLQALLVDRKGLIVDVVYFNKLCSFHNAVVHVGDCVHGVNEHNDETMYVKPHLLPEHVVLLVMVVAVHRGGTLQDVVSGFVTFFDHVGPVARLPLEQSHGCVDCVAVMKKSGDVWDFHKIDEPAGPGHTFLDILEPTIGDVIRSFIPSAPECVDVSFEVDVTKSTGVVEKLTVAWVETRLSVAVGWDFDLGAYYGHGVNLDLTGVFLNKEGSLYGCVSCAQKQCFGAVHSGDNRNGEGSGDDEQITLQMLSVPHEVAQIFFIVNVRTHGQDLSSLHGGFHRTTIDAGTELACHKLIHDERMKGKIFARLIRRPSSRWCLQELAKYCRGSTWMSAVQMMREMFHSYPTELHANAPPAQPMTGVEKRPKTARLRAAMIKRDAQRKMQCAHVDEPTPSNDVPRARLIMSL